MKNWKVKVPNKFKRRRWARLLKQQLSITIYCLPTKKTNFHIPFPFAANKQKFAVSIFRLQKTIGSCRFPLVPFSVSSVFRLRKHGDIHGDMETWKHADMQTWRPADMET